MSILIIKVLLNYLSVEIFTGIGKRRFIFFFNPLRLCLLLFVIKYRDTNYKRNFKSSDIKMKDIPSKS